MKIYTGKNIISKGNESAEAKAQRIAKSFIEKDPGLTYEKALAKVWENHPDLMTEYEKEAGFIKDDVGKSINKNQTTAETKIQSIAKGYVENDPNLTYDKALARAWEEHPELVNEYDRQAGF